MESSTFNHLKQIAQNSSDFKSFKNNLIDVLFIREPGASFDFVNPYTYIDSPIQNIKISDITNVDNLQARANMQIENIKRGVQGGHGVALGRQIYLPLAIKLTSSGTYDIVDGFHRILQIIMNGEKTIFAFVVGENKGLTLQDIFNSAKEPKD